MSTNPKIIVLGATGFVGRNLFEDLSVLFPTIGTTRSQQNTHFTFFDIENPDSWDQIVKLNPGYIINSIGYGVVKDELDVQKMIDINYLQTVRFYDFIFQKLPGIFLIHVGTAFEYSLENDALTEQSESCPLTYYGISKLLASEYLLKKASRKRFCILRPFNMFGPYEQGSKIIPHLILAQKNKRAISLSAGEQLRDFFYVKDLGAFIGKLVEKKRSNIPNVINVGSGIPRSIRSVADMISTQVSTFDTALWKWGELPSRSGESKQFYNHSKVGFEEGLEISDIEKGLRETIQYYLQVSV